MSSPPEDLSGAKRITRCFEVSQNRLGLRIDTKPAAWRTQAFPTRRERGTIDVIISLVSFMAVLQSTEWLLVPSEIETKNEWLVINHPQGKQSLFVKRARTVSLILSCSHRYPRVCCSQRFVCLLVACVDDGSSRCSGRSPLKQQGEYTASISACLEENQAFRY